MLCPICRNVNLSIADRQGIEIDYCPQCRGVWLDRGELDRIIERSEQASMPQPAMAQRQDYGEHRDRKPGDYSENYRRKRKKSILGELFDF